MERTLSADERIRRAEEIYYRRKTQNNGVRVSANSSKNRTNSDYKLLKKMIIQILICIMIYVIFYLIQNMNYLFSNDFINKTNEILSYDINFQNIYYKTKDFAQSLINTYVKSENKTDDTKNEKVENNSENKEEGEQPNPVTEENIGGAVEVENNNSEAELSQMEKDAKYIKEKYNLIKPIEGTITSRYGIRNPTTSTVPKNHTGIDIAANTGTVIHAALDGIVKIASSEGDYGKHLRIEKDDIAIYYAHCNKLYVKEGQQIKQGDAIAEVGATGNVTGPHLHFEIRIQERYVNPDLIMQF